jgi:CHAT domain-containing protein
MSRKDVDLLVQMYLRAMTSKDKNQVNVLSERVYDTFLKPVIHFVYGDRVGFVPHGTLYNLPFASMRYVKAYLVDGFTIFHLPHAGMIKRALSKKVMPQTKKALIYADPQHVEKQKPASHSEAETDTLKRLFPQADYVVKENASKANLQKLTGNYDVLHFSAATGTCYGGLSVHDIVRLQLSGRVTVFGDCLTTKGVSSADTGMLSLVAAWLYTVSPSVITTLWRVEDESRAAWVEMFYENLRKSGNVSDALRTAQNGMIQMGYGPSDWAAFVLIGHD